MPQVHGGFGAGGPSSEAREADVAAQSGGAGELSAAVPQTQSLDTCRRLSLSASVTPRSAAPHNRGTEHHFLMPPAMAAKRTGRHLTCWSLPSCSDFAAHWRASNGLLWSEMAHFLV